MVLATFSAFHSVGHIFVVINTSSRLMMCSSMHFLTALPTARSFLYRDAVSMERYPVLIAISTAGSHSDSEARNVLVFEGARIFYPKPRMGIRKPEFSFTNVCMLFFHDVECDKAIRIETPLLSNSIVLGIL